MIKKTKCPYMDKKADNPNSPNIEKAYEKGDRFRPYCLAKQDWCTFDFDYHECIIYIKAGE